MSLRSAARACRTLALAVAATALAIPASAVERMSAAPVNLLAGPDGAPTLVAPEATAFRATRTARFVVTYRGFRPEVRAAFQRAVDIWATQIASPVPITVRATFTPLKKGVLGSAGSNSLWLNFAGAPRKGTWYVDALANQKHGKQLDPSPDIVAQFNSDFANWHFGTNSAPKGKYDFTSVVLHELGHGLGFLGAGEVVADRGTVRKVGTPVIFDRFAENRSGQLLLAIPDNSKRLSDQLRGGNLFFDSAAVRAANQGMRARLYAPAVFEAGSSYSHLDEATYLRGDPNSLMTPRLGMGETIRKPGPIALGILRSLGW